MVLFRYYGYFLSCPNFVIDPLHFEKGTNTRRGRIFGSLKRANISGPIHKQGAQLISRMGLCRSFPF